MNTNELQIAALVGSLLPLVVTFVQQQHWSSRVRTIVGVVACVIASVVTALAEHKLNFKDWVTSFFIIFTLTKTTYLAVWKPTGIAPKLEGATSITPPAGTPNP